jgi:hypothetical protein
MRCISISPAVMGSHRPVGVVNFRRTSFHLQWCRACSLEVIGLH